MIVTYLPTLNAILNATSGILLCIGYYMIRKKNKRVHKRMMISAIITSLCFLTSYVIYHSFVGSVSFQGQGLIRPIYFTILTSHTVLAITIVPMVIITLSRALRSRFDHHRRIARWTFPIWLYVSVTGVLVYMMLYVLYPSRVVM